MLADRRLGRPGGANVSSSNAAKVEKRIVRATVMDTPFTARRLRRVDPTWRSNDRRSRTRGDIPFDLGIEDLTVGEGAEATKGTKVSVHYVGVAFSNGEEFDASWNRGQPFEFKLGKGQVIPGWDAGVEGMKVGGRRKLTIPSAMAYGARGAGGGVIKPHEPLVFVVDLLAVD